MPRRNRDRRETRLDSLVRLVDHADLAGDPQVQKLLAAASVSRSDTLRRRIEQVINGKVIQNQRQPFDEHSPRIAPWQERISLGVTITGSTYGLRQEDLTQHLLVIGQSGAGKTTLFYNLMDQLTVPFWTFDLKQDYRHLLPIDDDLLVLPWTDLKFNPLKPPKGVTPRRWAQVFSEVFGHATALLSGSKNYLMAKLVDLYHLYDLSETENPQYPSLHELQALMEGDKINYVRKTSNYRDTVVNRLIAMNLTSGTIFDCSEGYSIEALLNRNVVFEFDGLGTDLQNFLMEILFAYVYEYRLAQNHRGGSLRHVFFLDEGKQVFSVYKERQDAAGIPAIDELTAKMREFGEGLVVADQEVTKLTDSIKANTYIKCLLATGDAKQFDEIAASMHLTDRQEDIARTLGTGDAIIQVSGSTAIPVLLNSFELEKSISDTELQRRQYKLWNVLTSTPREPLIEVAEQGTPPESKESNETDTSRSDDLVLSGDAERLLEDIVTNPFSRVSDRYEQFSSVHSGNKAKKELLATGLVEEQRVTTGTGTRTLFELTDHGRDYVETCLEMDAKQRGRGGIIHRYWQQEIKQLFEAAGWQAKRELFDADVYVNMAGVELVIELAMTADDREVDHVKRHLDKGFDLIWIVCRTEDVKADLRKRLEEEGLFRDRVDLRLLQEIRGVESAQN